MIGVRIGTCARLALQVVAEAVDSTEVRSLFLVSCGALIVGTLCGCTVQFSAGTLTTGRSTQPGHAAYVAKANAICARYNAVQDKLVAGKVKKRAGALGAVVDLLRGTPQQSLSTAREVDVVGLREIQSLRRLAPVPSDRPFVASLLAEETQAMRLGIESTRLSDAADVDRLAHRAMALVNDANARAAAFGMTVCAR